MYVHVLVFNIILFVNVRPYQKFQYLLIKQNMSYLHSSWKQTILAVKSIKWLYY